MSGLSNLSVGASPYPGLRPFRSDEADIFFGREEHVDHLLEKLGQNRFLAVMGPSGCGKSSLMQAGVIPALETGFLVDAGAQWRIATMRPGNHPMQRLAESLLAAAALGPERAGTAAAAAVLQATLQHGPLGLVEVWRETPLPEATSLLLLVDQFEEIFRFRQQGYSSEAEADALVELLLATAAQRDVPVYVVLTMRSDFLGDCALFRGLPEAINTSQFLTPRLTRAQQRVAIEGPSSVFGGTVEAALVNSLLNDMGPDPDQLPLMQHVLMRMWTRKAAAAARAGDKDIQDAGLTLTLTDYAAVGGLNEALSRHADEAFAELDERHQRVAAVLFRCLSERSLERRDTRRPTPLSTVAAVAGVSWKQVAAVVEVFRRPDRSFLTPPVGMTLQPETMLDISHESLIRQWRRMTEWVDKEAKSAEAYRHLEQTARRWHAEPNAQRRKDYLWHGHELGLALDWRAQESPTSLWAGRYGTAFDLAMAFLDASAQEEEAQRQQQEAAQKRELQRTRRQFFAALMALLVVLCIAGIAWQQRVVAQRAQREAEEASGEAKQAKAKAEEATIEADAQRLLAEARRRPDELGVLLALQADKTTAANSVTKKAMQPQVAEALQEILGTAHFSHTLSVPHMEGTRIVAFSPDGRWLAVVARSRHRQEQRVHLWDMQSPKSSPIVLPHEGVRTLAFSPKGRFLASASQEVCLWDLEASPPHPEPCLPPSAHGAVQSLAFGPEGRRLVSGSSRGIVQVWDVQERTSFSMEEPDHDDSQGIFAVAFSPDGRWVASGGQDRKVRLWEVAKAQQQSKTYKPLTLSEHKSWVTAVAFHRTSDAPPNTDSGTSCQQQYVLASGSVDTTILLWDMALLSSASVDPNISLTPCKILQVEEGGVWAIAFSHDGKLLASSGDDRAVRLWDWQQPTPFPTVLRGHDGSVTTVAFSPDGDWVASGGFDHTVRLWEMHSPYILHGHDNGVSAVAFSPDGQRIVSSGLDSTVRLWQAIPATTPAGSSSVSFREDLDFQDRYQNPSEPVRHTEWVWAVAFSPDGTTFASGSFDNTVRLWSGDTHTLTAFPSPLQHASWVTAVQFSPQLQLPLLVTAERGIRQECANDQGGICFAGTVHLWDVSASASRRDAPRPLLDFPTEQKGTWSVAFSPDGNRFITGGGDGSVQLWDVQELLAPASAGLAVKPQRFQQHTGIAWSVAFSPDNRTIASGSIDPITPICVRDVDSGAATSLGGAKGHKGWVTSVVFSPNGQLLASGGGDGTVRLWNVAEVMQHARPGNVCETHDLAPTTVMRGHEGMVRCLAFSPDGQWLASGGGDKTLRLWHVQRDMQTATLREKACQRVWRNLSVDEWQDIVHAEPRKYEPTCPNWPPHPSLQAEK